MVLHVIGLGLGDCEDITVKGLKRVQSADAVFLECYTSVLGIDKDALVSFTFFFTCRPEAIDFHLGIVPRQFRNNAFKESSS